MGVAKAATITATKHSIKDRNDGKESSVFTLMVVTKVKVTMNLYDT